MFDFLKRKKTEEQTKQDQPTNTESAHSITTEEELSQKKKRGFFQRLKHGLQKTRSGFTDGLANLILSKKIDDQLLEDIEERLLLADIGVEACQKIIADLTAQVSRKELKDADALIASLKNELTNILKPCEQPIQIPAGVKPYVVLMVGVNGVGKTTTISKFANRLQNEGKKVMLAAGDTFRAAAIEQLQVWGERTNIPVIAQQQGADSASVAYDAFQAAKARNYDVLIIDTAGRLHTQRNLMTELQKVRRVITKLDENAPHEVMLVLDAGTGQNALNQAQQFNESVQISGITLTKLDGTAKGGIIFAIAKKMATPIRFIGIGESIDDLRPFSAEEFVAALFE